MREGEVSAPRIVTIDGPAGSGKSSVAKRVARELGSLHLNSGLLYRAVAYVALQRKVSLDAEEILVEISRSLNFAFERRPDRSTVFTVNGEGLGGVLTSEEVASAASRIAVLPEVRAVLTDYQRDLGERENLVLEGRDAGTVVFPDARWKFYLDAPLEVRVERRLLELSTPGNDPDALREQVKSELASRDERDRTRSVAPQVQPPGSIRIDTAGLTLEEVVAKVLSLLGTAPART